MQIRVLQATHPEMVARLDTEALRRHYLLTDLFRADELRLNYSHVERLIIGGAMPVRASLRLEGLREAGSGAFLARRELGVVNIGGAGRIRADGREYAVEPRDGLYLRQGCEGVAFESAEAAAPAKFYLVSAPAHASFENVKIPAAEARPTHLGSPDTSNQRTIYQYIHPDVCRSSQLLLGLTTLERGSVWNTMPPHLHDRRSEVYFYFDMQPEDRVFHFMGEPGETRHIVVANEQAVISPPWSIHMGAGTSRYAFIWAMAGENQDYKDMDAVLTTSLR